MVIYFHRHTTILTWTLSLIWDREINILHYFFFLPQVWLPVFYNLQCMTPECCLNHDLIWQGKATSHLFLFLCLAMKWLPRCNNLNWALIKIECGNRWSSCVSPMICPSLQKVKVTQIFIYLGKNKLGMYHKPHDSLFHSTNSVVAE